ncbi:MAG: HAMP domain-containing histidine kinase, partial [Lachnospiraceae bacterium]|nr:HAMP domain-containing histidine kinase [Lachnospiraceae bacterium]
LIEALLKLSKLDAGTVEFARETVPVEILIHNAAKPFGILMDLRGQTLDTGDVRPGAVFTGDLAWSTEAVGNVLKNCIEHTGEGGNILIKAQENAIYTEIVIEDDGEGIDAQDLPHLFERFYRGKNSSGNSVGIGLALTRAILLAQNGTICAENRREGGARFLLRIYKGII